MRASLLCHGEKLSQANGQSTTLLLVACATGTAVDTADLVLRYPRRLARVVGE